MRSHKRWVISFFPHFRFRANEMHSSLAPSGADSNFKSMSHFRVIRDFIQQGGFRCRKSASGAHFNGRRTLSTKSAQGALFPNGGEPVGFFRKNGLGAVPLRIASLAAETFAMPLLRKFYCEGKNSIKPISENVDSIFAQYIILHKSRSCFSSGMVLVRASNRDVPAFYRCGATPKPCQV